MPYKYAEDLKSTLAALAYPFIWINKTTGVHSFSENANIGFEKVSREEVLGEVKAEKSNEEEGEVEVENKTVTPAAKTSRKK